MLSYCTVFSSKYYFYWYGLGEEPSLKASWMAGRTIFEMQRPEVPCEQLFPHLKKSIAYDVQGSAVVSKVSKNVTNGWQ